MKRVCLVRLNYFPEEAHLRKNVDALVEAGYGVDVVCLRGKGERGREPYRAGTIYRLPLTHRRRGPLRYLFEYLSFFLLTFALLSYLSLRKRYHIVEVYNPPDFLVFAALVPRLLGARVILYLFEMMPELFAEHFTIGQDAWALRALRWQERSSAAFADRVIAVGPHEKLARETRGVPAKKLILIMNVPDESLFDPERHRSEAGDDSFNLISHGSVLERYGIQTIIRAVPHLRERIPGLHVWILGDGEYREALETIAHDLGVGAHVHFTGWLPSLEEVSAYIARSQVGIVPLLYNTQPNKLFEYVAMGKPTISADLPSIRAVFDDESMLFFPPGNHEELARRVLQLYADPALRARLVARARRVLQPYSWQEMRATYIQVHDELTASPSERAPLVPSGPGEGS